MSKLSELITAKITNERAYALEPYNINMGCSIKEDPVFHTRIRFNAVLGCEYYLPEDNKDVLAEALNNVRKSVIQEVFGEFRAPLHKIHHLLYKRDFYEASEALQALEKQMFNV